MPVKTTPLLFQNKAVHADIHTQTPPPSLARSPEPARLTGGGMRRDKPMVGLHQHMRLSKASSVTDRRSSGAQWEWEWTGLLRY